MKRGFILNSFWLDQEKYPLQIFGVNEEGSFLLRFDNQDPLFFIPQKSQNLTSLGIKREKALGLTSFDGEPVKALYFENLQKLYEARDTLSNMGIRSYENDIRPENRFLMERFINGPIEFEGEASGNLDGLKIYTNPQLRNGSFKPVFSQMSLDIETGQDGSLYSIGLSFSHGEVLEEMVFMLGEQDQVVNDHLTLLSSEKKVIQSFLAFLDEKDPDFIIGWHVVGFDLRFLAKKAQTYNISLDLGRDKSPLELQERGNIMYATIRGRIVLDGPPLLRANFFSFTNMKLDTVANEVLGSGKDISASGADKVEEIERRFREDKEALAFYNIEDCRLVHQIFSKLDIYNLLYSRALLSGLQIDKVGYSTGAFDHFFLPRLHRKGFVAPNILDMAREEQSAGGMVVEPQAGLSEKVAVFDFKSLYPSIIRTFSIDPYSRLKASVNPRKTPCGIEFSSSENILPPFLEDLGRKRENAKINGNKSLSQGIKILMNSFYGVMGSPKSRFYHSDLPTAITTTGHWILNQSISFFDNLGLKVIYGDTDSLFVVLTEQYHSEKQWQELATNLNYYLERLINDQFSCQSYLEVEMEKVYDKIFFSTTRGSDQGAKKRYVGWKNRTLDFVGMEYVRSDWTQVAKDFQYELFMRLFEGEPLETFIKEEIKKLERGDYDHKLVYKKKLSKKVEEYTKSVPPHIKAALQLPKEERERLRSISYVMTSQGPKPASLNKDKLDYEHYVEKQLRPVAQTILQSQGLSFDDIHAGNQLSMF